MYRSSNNKNIVNKNKKYYTTIYDVIRCGEYFPSRDGDK
jgi:hypothetical protein